MKDAKNTPVVLIVDDEPAVCETMKAILDKDFEAITAANGREALKAIDRRSVDLVFLDIWMPGIDGMEVLRRIKNDGRDLPVIMATAADNARPAVEAIQLGAFGYITKPFDPDEVITAARKAIENRGLFRELAYLRSQRREVKFDNIIGKSSRMKDIYKIVGKVARNNTTVLISGDSGTGKELIARAIHFNSLRAQKPFIAVDCASIPENLMESELFGHEKGAFTGAASQKIGMFELADEGTLFLDEISDLKPDMQAKLLRVLEEREIKRVGASRIIRVDVRIISATNIDLKKAMGEGTFRQDLYYRLNVVPISLPALRERREDISLLLKHFIEIYNKRFKKRIDGLTEEAMGCLIDYDWPGNVRELKNIIERIAVLKDEGTITAEDLPFDISIGSGPGKGLQAESPLKDACRDFERRYIRVVLERVGGNQSKAARILGIHRNALFNKMRSLRLKK